MHQNIKRSMVVLSTVITTLFVSATVAMATPATPSSFVTDQAADLKDEALLLLAAVVPISIFFMLVRRGLSWVGIRKGRTV